jgi:formylmethanofuran dehydrogenase subunit E
MIKEMGMKKRLSGLVFGWVVLWGAMAIGLCGAAETGTKAGNMKELNMGKTVMGQALKALGLEKGDKRLLALTNAGYGTINGHSTEAFLDALSGETGCTMGTGTLLTVHTPFGESLWWALYRKDTGKMHFTRWRKGGFPGQEFGVAPDQILVPRAWKQAAAGIVGKRTLFSVVTISNGWAAGAPWSLLKTAEFHNHLCPGLEAGYLIAGYVKKTLPVQKGERYVFICSPPFCPTDALQMMFDATAGKGVTYAKAIPKKKQQKYAGTLWYPKAAISPLVGIAMRVNQKKDSCHGVVLGMDWNRLYTDAGMRAQDFSPPGGKANSLFHVSRTRLALKMRTMSMSEKRQYLKEINQFSGRAGLAQQLAAGGSDPYETIWGR